MTCADQTMIRRAQSRAGILAIVPRIGGLLRLLVRPLVGRVDDLNDHMLRDVGLCDGRRTEERMRSDLVRGQPFDQLRY
jgi:hypothetical protein